MPEQQTKKWSIRDRTLAVLQGRKPDRIPFIGRLELWRKGQVRTGALPNDFWGLTLTEIHRAVGFGRQRFVSPYSTRLRNVEVSVSYEGESIHRETNPIVERFPDADEFVPAEKVGDTRVEFVTPVGALSVEYTMLPDMLDAGARCYMRKHPITEREDYAVAEYVVEHMEVVPNFDRIEGTQNEFGEIGFVVPQIERIPFQQLLIDYINTSEFFFALHDEPTAIDRLLHLLDQKLEDILAHLAHLEYPYVQIGDNLDGIMTNPKLFTQYCLPYYQRYSETLHGQGKKAGTHADGDLKPLLALMAETGLDVSESSSPAPLTPTTVEEAMAIWQGKPIVWGGIPSPLLEEGTSESEFEQYMRNLLDMVGSRPIILNVVDMVLPINSIQRIRRIAEMVEAHAI